MNKLRIFKALTIALMGALGVAQSATAATILPASYEMNNGDTGSYTYWDDTYNGSGSTTTSGAYLSGGVGDLTDGVIATANWFNTPALYVGWSSRDPLIKFHFAAVNQFQQISIYFDDADGAGGVSAPSGVTINGTFYAVNDPSGSAPFVETFNVNLLTDTLDIQLHRRNAWVFASEIQFSSVPLPGSLMMFVSGLLAVFSLKSRSKR